MRPAALTVPSTGETTAFASLSIALLNVFQQNMTSGLGFIAVALVYFGGWRPLGVLLGALLNREIERQPMFSDTLRPDENTLGSEDPA